MQRKNGIDRIMIKTSPVDQCQNWDLTHKMRNKTDKKYCNKHARKQ